MVRDILLTAPVAFLAGVFTGLWVASRYALVRRDTWTIHHRMAPGDEQEGKP